MDEESEDSYARRRCLNFASGVQKGGVESPETRIPVMTCPLQPSSLPVIAAPSNASTSASQIMSLPRFLLTSAAAAAFSARYPASETAVRSRQAAGRLRERRCWVKALRKVLAALYAA